MSSKRHISEFFASSFVDKKRKQISYKNSGYRWSQNFPVEETLSQRSVVRSKVHNDSLQWLQEVFVDEAGLPYSEWRRLPRNPSFLLPTEPSSLVSKRFCCRLGFACSGSLGRQGKEIMDTVARNGWLV